MPKDTYELHQKRMRELLTPEPVGVSLVQRFRELVQRRRLPRIR